MQGTVHAGVEGAKRLNRGWRAKRKSLLHSEKRRVKEKVVLPDPRSHPWKLELHYACLLGAEIRQKPLLLAMPSKTERGTG